MVCPWCCLQAIERFQDAEGENAIDLQVDLNLEGPELVNRLEQALYPMKKAYGMSTRDIDETIKSICGVLDDGN